MFQLSPVLNGSQIDFDGHPLVGGRIYWYLAGTSTPAPVYTDPNGGAQHTNPIILNSRGESASAIWLDDQVAYKAVLADATDVVLRTIDGIRAASGSGGGSGGSMWEVFQGPVTYVSPTEFSVAGNQMAAFHEHRRVRLQVGVNTVYGTIVGSTYSTSTTVEVALDAGVLDGTLGGVALGLAVDGSPLPTQLPGLGPSWEGNGDTSIHGVLRARSALVVDGDSFHGGHLKAETTAEVVQGLSVGGNLAVTGTIFTSGSPKFSAQAAAISASGNVSFGTVHHNVGDGFGGTIFTAPVPGLYRFDFSGQIESRSGGAAAGFAQAILLKNPGGVFLCNAFARGEFGSSGEMIGGSSSLRLCAERYLAAGDQVRVSLGVLDAAVQVEAGATFSGRLLP